MLAENNQYPRITERFFFFFSCIIVHPSCPRNRNDDILLSPHEYRTYLYCVRKIPGVQPLDRRPHHEWTEFGLALFPFRFHSVPAALFTLQHGLGDNNKIPISTGEIQGDTKIIWHAWQINIFLRMYRYFIDVFGVNKKWKHLTLHLMVTELCVGVKYLIA